MDNIWYYITNFLQLDEIVILSHVNNNLFIITRQLKNMKSCDLIYQTIKKNYTNVTKFLIEQQYNISKNTLNLTISLGNFELLNRMNIEKKYDNEMMIAAIKSNNIKMVKFIKNRLGVNYVYDAQFLDEIIKIDNADVYKFLIGGAIDHHRLTLFINHNCINIIESYRFNSRRRSYERVVLQHAVNSNNQIMMDYCLDNDYYRH